MRSIVQLAAGQGFSVSAVTCREHHRAWSDVESPGSYRLVLVRQGRFRRRVRAGVADLDRTVAYVGLPGEEEHFAHPHGGDVCTSVGVHPGLWHTLAGDSADTVAPTVYVDARLELAHRGLLATARGGDVDFALAEGLLATLAPAIKQAVTGPLPAPAPAPSDAAVVAAARDVILAAHPASAGLFPLAELLGVSPYRLSRAFPRVLGVSLTRYRNRVRVERAMDRLEQGEGRLADLAAELGFSDQAHLTRTLREHVGHTPTALRRLLAVPERGSGDQRSG